MDNSSKNQICFLLAAGSAFAVAMASARFFGGDVQVEEPWLTEFVSTLENKPKVSKKVRGSLITYRFDCIPSTMIVGDFYQKYHPH